MTNSCPVALRQFAALAGACIVALALGVRHPAHAGASAPAAFISPPPIAPLRPITDSYAGGHTVVDPYQWMEDLDSPDMAAWLKGQSVYANAVLRSIPGHDALLARIKALDSNGTWASATVREGDLVFYDKLTPADQTTKLYVFNRHTRQEKLLLDPNASALAGVVYALRHFAPSPDGKYVAVEVYPNGSEISTISVVDVATGKLLPDRIENIRFGSPQWLPDSTGFFYSRPALSAQAASPLSSEENSVVYLHDAGSDSTGDRAVFGYGVSPATNASIDAAAISAIVTSAGSSYAIGQVVHGTSEELTLYTVALSALNGAATPWVKLVDIDDKVIAFRLHASTIYLNTRKNAAQSRIVAMSLAHPDFSAAKTIVPAGHLGISFFGVAKDALYIGSTGWDNSAVRRIAFDGSSITQLPIPESGPINSMWTDPQRDGVRVWKASWTHSDRLYAYNPATKKALVEPLSVITGIESSALRSVEVSVPAKDGVLVPLSIVYSKNDKLDGTHPTMLYAYGSYGKSLNASFDPVQMAWFERGGIYAVAHVRGGGELGYNWIAGGYKATKPNTWNDLIACAEYLIQKRYTSPAHLGLEGASAGGIAVGRAFTDRPDLFAAVLDEVGASDTVRQQFSSNGVLNIPEFGDVNTPSDYAALYNMDTYLHVKSGVKYPAVLLTTGIHDARVAPWQPAKLTAALQAESTSGKPVLLRVDYNSGHGYGATRDQADQLLADEWSFLFWQLGAPGFQPKAGGE